jgi:hypothetical protein
MQARQESVQHRKEQIGMGLKGTATSLGLAGAGAGAGYAGSQLLSQRQRQGGQ